VAFTSPHLSKAQDLPLTPGDRVRARDPAAVAEDVRLGRYTPEQAARRFGPPE
jgi:N-methylhydantoinase B